MKAHTHFSIALLMATCYCFNGFCADPAKKIPNRKERDILEREYTDLDAQKKKDHVASERKYKIAAQMKDAYTQLQTQGYDQHAQMRKEQIEDWAKKEKQSENELRTCAIQNLEQMNATVFNTLKNNKDLTPTQKAELYKQQYEIVHKLKELQHAETITNPHNKQAEISEQHYMIQSMLLTQLKETAPQTPAASEPVPTVITPTSSFASSYVKTTADRPTPALTEVKVETPIEGTEQKAASSPLVNDNLFTAQQKNDKNCIIL